MELTLSTLGLSAATTHMIASVAPLAEFLIAIYVGFWLLEMVIGMIRERREEAAAHPASPEIATGQGEYLTPHGWLHEDVWEE